MLYNIPGRTGQNLLPETAAKLAAIDNIVAIKEASGNLEQAAQINCLTAGALAIYSGDDSLTLPLMTVGAVGIVSVAGHLVGEQIQQMIQSFIGGNTTESVAINLKLFPLFKALFCTTNPIPVKAALKMQGWKLGTVRLPLSELPSELKPKLEKVLKDLSLI
jgi:4-hydroxy-tetrahydrodipicolinate synthase